MVSSPHESTNRAQSEVVGVALLVGIVAILMLIVGGVLVGNVANRAGDEPLVDLNVSASPHNLTLAHGGGEPLHATDVTVIVRQNGAEWTYDLGSFREIHGRDPSRFSPGERWQHGHSLAPDIARVLVVHTPSNTVVYDDVVPVPAETNVAPVSRFGYTPMAPGTGQQITFDAGNATDSDGVITHYAWDFDGDGTIDATGQTVTHTYSTPAAYNVTLTVTDNAGYTDTDTVTVTVENATPPSVSNFAVTNPSGQNVQVSFDTNESLQAISLSISGAESATLTRSDFTETTTGSTYAYTAVYAGSSDGTYTATLNTATDAAGNDGATGQLDSVVVDTTGPSIANPTLSDSDGNNIVTSDDAVTISASVSDAIAGVHTVTADVGALDAGTVTLTDGNDNGTYTATTNVGSSPIEGQQSVTIMATDDDGNENIVKTNTIVVDTTAPQIQSFNVSDRSGVVWFFWLEQYEISWNTNDAWLKSTTVYVNRSGTNQAIYSGENDTQIYQQVAFTINRTHTIKIIALDKAGNRACRVVHDGADGTGPTNSQYESC